MMLIFTGLGGVYTPLTLGFLEKQERTIMRRFRTGIFFVFVSWVVSGCGSPEPEPPKAAPVGPATDPAGEAFSRPTKRAGAPAK